MASATANQRARLLKAVEQPHLCLKLFVPRWQRRRRYSPNAELAAMTPVLLLLLLLLGGPIAGQIQNADYSGKVNVRVNHVLTKRPRSDEILWQASPGRQQYAQVDVSVLGQQSAAAAFHKLRPSLAHLNSRKLRRILGAHFEKAFMSISPPASRSDPKHLPLQTQDPALQALVARIKFNFTDAAGASLRLDRQHETMFRTWLLQQATCPVDFFWQDLGDLFWPRWVRRGRCLPTHRCSWPPGMQCRASHSRTLKLLHWKCSAETREKKKKRELAEAVHLRRLARHGLRRWKRRKRRRGKRGRGWEARERRKYQRIRRRLIRKLSMASNGYFCQWKLQGYVVHDRCSCLCNWQRACVRMWIRSKAAALTDPLLLPPLLFFFHRPFFFLLLSSPIPYCSVTSFFFLTASQQKW